jgi:hypothetical protein
VKTLTPRICRSIWTAPVTPVLLMIVALLDCGCASPQKSKVVPPSSTAKAHVSQIKTTVSATKGDVFLIRNGLSKSLSKGRSINVGDIIETGSNGQADLYLGSGLDRSMIRIGPKAKVHFAKLSLEKKTRFVKILLTLDAGELLGKAQSLAPESRFEIKTSRGVLGVRGKDAVFLAASDFRIQCLSGTIVCSSSIPNGPCGGAIINAGQAFDPEKFSVNSLASPMVAVLESFNSSK